MRCEKHDRQICSSCGICPASKTLPQGYEWKYAGRGARELHVAGCPNLRTVDWNLITSGLKMAGLRVENEERAKTLFSVLSMDILVAKIAAHMGIQEKHILMAMKAWKAKREEEEIGRVLTEFEHAWQVLQ